MWAMLGLLLCLAACRTETDSNETEVITQTTDHRKVWLALVNNLRREGCRCGSTYYPPVPALTWNESLERAALKHSEDMHRKKYFAHVSKGGRDTAYRIEAEGFEWSAYGENLFMAEGYVPSEKEVVETWRKSPAHCKNLMNKDFREMGIGHYETRWTQVFGTKL